MNASLMMIGGYFWPFACILPPTFWWASWCLHTSRSAGWKAGIGNTSPPIFCQACFPFMRANISSVLDKTLGWMTSWDHCIYASFFFLNETHMQMVIQMFPSNKINLTVGATVLRQLPGTHLTETLPCMCCVSIKKVYSLSLARIQVSKFQKYPIYKH